jgi:serine protease Do
VLDDLTSGRKAAQPAPGDVAWNLLGIQVRAARVALVVSRVRQGSPAERVGLEPGDLVLGVDGEAVGSLDALGGRLDAARGDGSIVLSVARAGRRYDLQVPLGDGT